MLRLRLEQVLAEAKEAKEAAFQAQWKQMKTGKLLRSHKLAYSISPIVFLHSICQ